MHAVIHTRLVAFLASIVAVGLLSAGCASTATRQETVMREADKFYTAYTIGDAGKARQSLLHGIQFVQSLRAEVLSPAQKAIYLFGNYARLYVLETKIGNLDDAEAALIKARYWHLQSYELSQDGWKTRVRLHEFLSSMTPEWITTTMEKLEKNSNGGSGPKYLRQM